jgi:hypothetical protein
VPAIRAISSDNSRWRPVETWASRCEARDSWSALGDRLAGGDDRRRGEERRDDVVPVLADSGLGGAYGVLDHAREQAASDGLNPAPPSCRHTTVVDDRAGGWSAGHDIVHQLSGPRSSLLVEGRVHSSGSASRTSRAQSAIGMGAG